MDTMMTAEPVGKYALCSFNLHLVLLSTLRSRYEV